jgi:hypothetical protein
MKESDLFIYLKDYFSVNPYNEIFTEVLGLEGGRPDIVIRTDKKIITIVEMKTSLSMELLEQSVNWRYKANYVYIAIPERKNKRINRFALKILKDNGIGILLIKVPSKAESNIDEGDLEYRDCVTEMMKPKLFRPKKDVIGWNNILKHIYKYENNIAGGSKGKGYNTPYKAMIIDVKRYIYRNKNKFVQINELIEKLDSIKSHYSNPKASLYNALSSIEDEQFEMSVVNKKILFRLTENAYKNYDVYEW